MIRITNRAAIRRLTQEAGVDLPAAKRKREPSSLEQSLAAQLDRIGYKYEREYQFRPDRRWRIDFALCVRSIRRKLAVECQGGTWSQGRHNRGSSTESEYRKLNALNADGWTVILVTGAMIKSGEALRTIEAALKG